MSPRSHDGLERCWVGRRLRPGARLAAQHA